MVITVSEKSSDGTQYSVTWQYGPTEQQHIRDANRAEDCPDELSFEVDNGVVTAKGTPEAIRWLYDYLHYLKRAWRQEGEQWDAEAAEDMAESLYEQTDGDLPDRQRSKEALTDGGVEMASDGGADEEYWVRRPEIPDQRKVYIRVIDRQRAEIIGEGDDEPRQISLYEVWQTDRQTGLTPTSKARTPWSELEQDEDIVSDGGCSIDDTERSGLFEKYEVRKEGEPVESCFVLEPRSDFAAREALIRYAEETDDEELAEDLREWVTRLCTRGAQNDR